VGIYKKVKLAVTQLAYLPQTFQLIWFASRSWTAGWLILLLVQGVMPAATVYLTRLLVNSLVVVVGAGLSWSSVQMLLLPIGLMAAVLLLSEVLQGAIEWARSVQAELVQDHISQLIHQQAISIDVGCYESPEYNDLLSQARLGADSRPLAIMENLGALLQSSITLIALTAILIPYGVWIPILLGLSTLPAFYTTFQLNLRQYRWSQRTTIDRRKLEYYDFLLTNGWMASELRLFNFGPFFQSAFQRIRTRLRKEQMRFLKQQTLSRFGAALFSLLISGLALIWIGRQVLLGIVTLGDLAMFYQAFNQGQTIARNLLGSLGQIFKNTLYISNLFTYLSLRPEIVDPPLPKPIAVPLQQGIGFHDITFRYPGSHEPVLEHFNLTLPAGKIVAIVGDNGAGKSTLIKLLCRFYDPESGSVTLDGVDLRDFSVRSLRQIITVLFQFHNPYYITAAESIALGDLSKPFDQSEIESAAKGAGIHAKLTRLPSGYDALLGKWFPGGTELSGGEWQRLALARAFFRRAQIIILDEPTSAMDPWAEHDWLERFRTMASGRTALVITHRFTLARQADIIHVMRNGQIAESGSHEELLAKEGLYARSWKSQLQMPTANYL